MKRLATLALAVTATLPAAAAPISILFVGNSYTFGRLDPVLPTTPPMCATSRSHKVRWS